MRLIWNSKVKEAAEGLAKTLEKALDGRCTSCGYSLSGFRAKINPDLCAPCERDKHKASRVEALLDKAWEKNRLGF